MTLKKPLFRGYVLLGLFLSLTLLVGACSSTPKKGPSTSSTGSVSSTPSDTALFQEGCSLLGTPGTTADYDKAKETFDRLVLFYPKSKWRPYAESYSRLLDEMKALIDRIKLDRKDAEKTQFELGELRSGQEQLKKANRQLQEKLQTETARLQQENDQLKNDLQRLKQLEIELQRRDRLFR